jgi:hypothetical protein
MPKPDLVDVLPVVHFDVSRGRYSKLASRANSSTASP